MSQLWNIVNDMEKFVAANQVVIKDGKILEEWRKWFLNVNHKNKIITIHPQGGREDINKKLSKFAYLNPNNPDPLPGEIVGARNSESSWYGPFKDIYSTYGYACMINRFYQKRTGQELPVRSEHNIEIDFSAGVAF